MANFRVHVGGALVASAVLSGAFAMGGLCSLPESMVLAGLGTVGGMMPDVDAETSIPTRILWGTLGCLGATALVWSQYPDLSILQLVAVWVVGFVLVSAGLAKIASWLCVHRGMIHSVPMALSTGLLAAIMAERWLGVTGVYLWLVAMMISFGFTVHLLLDELYSVDLLGARMKRSSGTALKLYSRKQPLSTLLVYILLGVSFWWGPSPHGLDVVWRTFGEQLQSVAVIVQSRLR